MMELYENFHCLKQNKSVEEYTAEFNNLSIRVGLSESNEQIASRYLAGLNQSIRDEMGVVRLYNIEDARQYALAAEKQVSRYGARKPLFSSNWQSKPGGGRGYLPTSQNYSGAATNSKTGEGTSDVVKSDKGKSKMPYGGQNSYNSKGGNNSQVQCFTCGEIGHTSFTCPQRRVNLAEVEEELEPVYDEELEEVDVHPA